MKKSITSLFLAVMVSCGCLFAASCSCNGLVNSNNSNSSNDSVQTEKLDTPRNVTVSDEYILTFDAVSNATSYEITTDFFTFINIGNVTTYDLSNVYGSSVGVKAVTSDESYNESSVAVATLDNYANTLTSFEEGLGTDGWSGSLVGYAELFGPSTEQSHSGNNAFKVFCGNSQNYFGGALFDTGFYNAAGQIDFANVKEISWWSYIDTQNLTEIEALCETYESKYNAEIANVEEVYGIEAGGFLQIFYANDEKEDVAAFDKYTPDMIKTNQWYKTTVDVSLYKEITDITLIYGNSVRSFTGDNGPGQWGVPSDYSYLLYWDDIEVVYDPIQLDTPTDITYEDGVFSWLDVENASAYEVTFDNQNWQKVKDTYISAEDQNIQYFGIKAVNGRKYADGTARYAESPVVYFFLDNAFVLDSKLDVSAKTIACEEIEGEISDITINGFKTTGSYANGLLTIAELPDTLVAGNNYLVFVNTAKSSYVYNVECWTSIISNATEFKAMIETINASNSSAHFLFDADIDAKDVTWTAVNGRIFSGVIDGAGHTVSNMQSVSTGYMGLVRELTGTIKNIAFVNGVGERCFLVYQMSGTLENVYVEATVTTNWTWFGVCSTYRNDGVAVSVKNCVFNTNVQDFDGGGGAVGTVYTNGQVSMSNVYVYNRSTCPILDDNNLAVIDVSANSGMSGSFTFNNIYAYTTTNNFLKGLSFNAQDGWAEFWTKEESGSLKFGDNILVDYVEFIPTKLNISTSICEIGEVVGSIEEVTLDETELAFEYENGILRISSDLSAIEVGKKYYLTVVTDIDTFKYEVEVIESPTIYSKLDVSAKTIACEEIEGEISDITINGFKTTGSYANGLLTIAELPDTLVAGNNYMVYVNTAMSAYVYSVETWTSIISNATEFKAMIETMNASNSSAHFLFDADIDAKDVTWTAVNGRIFSGVIDGAGHTVSNMKSVGTGYMGMVKELKGTIKNIAFVNGVGERCFLVYQMSGTLENVYVEAAVTTNWTWFGVCSTYRNDGVAVNVKNCVFNTNVQDYDGNGGAVGAVYTNGAVSMSNVYIFNRSTCPVFDDNSANVIDISAGNGTVDSFTYTDIYAYTKTNNFLKALSFNDENGWASYWSMDENKNLIFGGKTLVSYIEYTNAVLNMTEKTCEIGEVDGTISSITLGESELEYTYENGVLTINSDLSAFAKGESYYMIVVTDVDTYKYLVVVEEITIKAANYDMTNNTAVVGEINGTVQSLTVNGMELEGSYENGVITITSAVAGLTANSTYLLIVATDTEKYGFELTTWTMIVSNKTELQAMVNMIQGTANDAGYYMLDASVDATGVTSKSAPNNFYGVIDGNGYTVSNFAANAKGLTDGFFGTIKNIAFTSATTSGSLFGYELYGNAVVSNVYVELTITSESPAWYGVFGKVRSATSSIANCVFNVSVPVCGGKYTSYGGVLGACVIDGSLSNVYLIKNNCGEATPFYGSCSSNAPEADLSVHTNVVGYTSCAEFVNGVEFSAKNGWAEYWSIDANGNVLFNNTIIVEK